MKVNTHTPIMCAWVFDESASKFGVERAPYCGEAVVGNNPSMDTMHKIVIKGTFKRACQGRNIELNSPCCGRCVVSAVCGRKGPYLMGSSIYSSTYSA